MRNQPITKLKITDQGLLPDGYYKETKNELVKNWEMDAQHNQKKHLVKQSGTALGRELTQSNSLAFSLAHSTVPTIVIMLIAGRRMKSKNTSAHLTRRAEMQ